MVVVKGEPTSLFDFERDSPQDVVERVQADAQAALEEQGVEIDV